MKRFICLLIAAAMLFILISCADSGNPSNDDKKDDTADDAVTAAPDDNAAAAEEQTPAPAVEEAATEPPPTEPEVPAEPIGSCEFIEFDRTTQGEWVGAYGADGHLVLSRDDDYKLPAYAKVDFETFNGDDPPHHVWYQESETDEDDLDEEALERVLRRKPGTLYTDTTKTDRSGACYYNGEGVNVYIDIGSETKIVTLYSLDYDEQSRETAITVYDGNGKIKLVNTMEIAEFSGGVYVKFKVSGKIKIEYENLTGGQNAVIGAVFFDKAG